MLKLRRNRLLVFLHSIFPNTATLGTGIIKRVGRRDFATENMSMDYTNSQERKMSNLQVLNQLLYRLDF